MSVLTIPRIFFRGVSEWNPATTNNNDQWPTYDFVHAELNWAFLGTQTPPITRDNVRAHFPQWILTPQFYQDESGSWWQPPAEWNFFGGNEATLYSATTNQQTVVTGGQAAYRGPVITDDALVQAEVNILGDPYPGATTPTAPRLVDVNPDAFWSTEFFLRSVQVGDGSDPSRYLYGQVQPGVTMSSRWMNVQRNLNTRQELEIAGVAGIVVQACLPNDTLRINAGESQLLAQLDQARRQEGVAGVMVRYAAYTTQYFNGPEFQEYSALADRSSRLNAQYARLLWLWQQALQTGQAPPQNPAISRVVGTVGLWLANELVSVPDGRYLVPSAAQAPRSSQRAAPLGPAAVELHAAERVLSLDLGNTIPEIDAAGTKADFGSLDLQVALPGQQSKTIGTLTPADYKRESYEATAGIIDLSLPADVSVQDVEDGMLSLSASGTALLQETALSPAALTVQTDQRGIWLDQGESASLTIHVRQRGQIPTQTVHVLLQQYVPYPPVPAADSEYWTLASGASIPSIGFPDAPKNIVTMEPSARGSATVTLEPIQPGFPIIVFFPFLEGEATPVPPPSIIPVFQPGSPLTITSAFYCCVRVMPFDNALPQAFANLWNTTHDPAQAWTFVYAQILYLYDMIFPAMKYYAGLDLGDQEAVGLTIGHILQLTSPDLRDQTVYMPVTRDLSAGKRAVLQMYGNLLQNGMATESISVPAGFGGATPRESVATR